MTEPTTPANAPEWMHFLNFDGRLTGSTAQIVKQVAEHRGISPTDLLDEILTEALAARLSPHNVRPTDTKVEPMTINAGNGGFHVLTFVADGYGNLVAEDSDGQERARTVWESATEEGAPQDEFRQLAEQVFAKAEAQTTD